MARILIIDDDAAFREGLAETLEDLGHQVLQAADAQRGRALIEEGEADLVFLDYRLPGRDGLAVLGEIGAGGAAAPPVIMLTAFATSDNTIEAMKLGAFDHLTKPIGRADVAAVLERALRHPPARALSHPVGESAPALIGNSAAMREVQKLVGKAAASDATVLITGETGTGKEMVARALHENSRRAAKPLVAVNCAAIPADLLESELFGHVKGAFTGAAADRAGRFREADGGSLLLDEVGDMSLAMQAKILRALQEREITPVGASRSEKVDVRVIAATHRDLGQAVREATFREDLYYRLNVVPIPVPPLRERRSDVILLAEHFLRAAAAPPKTLSPAASHLLLGYAWPGNVRELKNAMERVSVLTRGAVIEAEDLGFLATSRDGIDSAASLPGDLPAALARVEEEMIRKALREAGGNRAEAARRLGIHRQLLYAKIKAYHIES